jgi:hypothetical protein
VNGVAELRQPEGTARTGAGALGRAALALLAASAAFVGGWALLAPASFYRSFPGLGLGWVADAGPYDEHLVRDVGALYLALLAVTLVSLFRPAAARPWVAGLAWLVFGVPHLAFHSAHQVRGQVPELTVLAASVLLALVACLPPRRR